MFDTKKEDDAAQVVDSGDEYIQNVDPLADSGKGFWSRLWPVMACGAGLFSDGYINNVRRDILQHYDVQVIN